MVAFILCKFSPGKEQEAIGKIRRVSAVKDVYMTFGGWDAVVIAEAPTMDKISAVVVSGVRGVDGVQSTETLVSASS